MGWFLNGVGLLVNKTGYFVGLSSLYFLWEEVNKIIEVLFTWTGALPAQVFSSPPQRGASNGPQGHCCGPGAPFPPEGGRAGG